MKKELLNLLDNEIDPAFRERARFIFEWIERKKPAYVLDAGCGRGFYVQALTSFPFIKTIDGFDLNETYLAQAKKRSKDTRVELRVGNIYKLPYKKNSFDLIICSEVLEHLPNDAKALLALKSLLKPDGILLITVPNARFPFLWDPLNWILMKVFKTHVNKNIWWLAGIWADHERLYRIEDMKNLMNKSKLYVEELKEVIMWSWPFAHFMLYGIGKNIIERLHVEEFSRFDARPRLIAKLLSRLFRLPSDLLDTRLKTKSSMNLLVALRKTD